MILMMEVLVHMIGLPVSLDDQFTLIGYYSMRSDFQIHKDVNEELRWNPLFRFLEFEAGVGKGVVTLVGIVDSYPMKLAVVNAIKGIAGVKAVMEDIRVDIPRSSVKTDAEITEMALETFKWHALIQEEKLRIKVKEGIVRLEGHVEWNYERTIAITAIENLIGVRSVISIITIKPKAPSVNIKNRICHALLRNATLESRRIRVDVMGNTVTLRGKVSSLPEKDDAERAAWATAGVNAVDNKLEIQFPEYILEST